jgi:hypothetical protein
MIAFSGNTASQIHEVIPAKAGIQFLKKGRARGPELDSRVRGNDTGDGSG